MDRRDLGNRFQFDKNLTLYDQIDSEGFIEGSPLKDDGEGLFNLYMEAFARQVIGHDLPIYGFEHTRP